MPWYASSQKSAHCWEQSRNAGSVVVILQPTVGIVKVEVGGKLLMTAQLRGCAE
jgi:hypothetical protein